MTLDTWPATINEIVHDQKTRSFTGLIWHPNEIDRVIRRAKIFMVIDKWGWSDEANTAIHLCSPAGARITMYERCYFCKEDAPEIIRLRMRSLGI